MMNNVEKNNLIAMTNANQKKGKRRIKASGCVTSLFLAWVISWALSAIFEIDSDKGSIILVVVVFVVIIFLMYQMKKLSIARSDRLSQKIVNVVGRNLDEVSYYYNNYRGGIGIDIKEQKAVVVDMQKKETLKTPIFFSFDKITEYERLRPGHTEYTAGKVYGTGSVANAMEASSINSMERASAASKTNASKMAALQKTGMYFSLDDIYMPKVFVPMDYEDAESWMVLIKKVLSRDIEIPSSPVRFPLNQ